jgi:hypothetical protein
MQSLLSNLKPHDNGDENGATDDEEVQKIIDRKVSMNESNVIGTNFEKYNNFKPSQLVRRKIANYF